MNSSAVESNAALGVAVQLSDDELTVELADGRRITAPLAWYPRLAHGTAEERANWRWIGRGHGIHWPNLDEDVSVDNLLQGKPSCESQDSLNAWLRARDAAPS